ncbi:MAG: APC family permease, partial [Rudaea sp.]
MPDENQEPLKPPTPPPGDGTADRRDGKQPKPVNLDLVSQEMHQGARAGDRYVRVVRPYGHLFQRIGPGYLRATEEVLEPKTPLGRALSALKHVFIGQPLPSYAEREERLSKIKALAIFSSDAISSVAYATEEILFVLALGGTAALALSVPISLVIALLLCIVAFSYRQTVFAYPNGGGSYVVSKENIGTLAGLVAAAALMLDYILTVSVSIASGTAAITSAFSFLFPYRVPIALFFILIMIVGNLRGIRESGNIFAAPTYVFLFSLCALIAIGAVRAFLGLTPVEPVHAGPLPQQEAIGFWLILTAFSAGSVAMSGTEAISNGVPAFKPPESKNAATTLLVMAGILAFFFMGIGLLANLNGISVTDDETVLSQLARGVLGKGFLYYVIQFATMAILVLAANTSFNGFPRLAAIIARDGFMPRRFTTRGDRLAFSYGIIVLGGVAALLIVAFEGDTHLLIPLYAVGVFLAFTLSQVGMMRHWLRLRSPGWKRSMSINAVGAAMCAVVLVIAAVTKFSRGAW